VVTPVLFFIKYGYLLEMRIEKKYWMLIILSIILTSLFISQLGTWRMEAASAFVRGVINPVEGVPTPLQSSVLKEVEITKTQVSTPMVALSEPTVGFTPTSIPSNILLDAPKWEKQDWNNCGPATIAMYFRYYGWEGTQFDISSIVKPERPDRNVNIEELLFYAHNQIGWLETINRVGGNINILKNLLAEGIPVMVEAGYYLEESYWPDDDMWAGHYLLLTGYDDLTQKFIVQDSFKGSNLEITYSELQEGWKAFNYGYILSYLPSQKEIVLSVLGNEMDLDNNREQTLARSIQDTLDFPDDPFVWFNLGSNYVFFEDYPNAIDAYNKARILGLPQRMLRYQFGPFLTYFHGQEMEELAAILEYALQITPNSEEALVWQGWYFYRLGDTQKSIESFREAYWHNTLSADALYGLNFFNASP
jgi:hypothetical protein